MLKIILGVIFIYPLINLVIGKVNSKEERGKKNGRRVKTNRQNFEV